MSATDELRRMLDERGVEHVFDEEDGEKYPPEKSVTWSFDLAGEDMTVTARDYCISIKEDGSGEYCLDLEFHEVFTPAQAIAATLGTGTCKNMDGETDAEWFSCSECNTELRVHEPFSAFSIRFCPNCGRRVE